jgi:hypothetical protein
VAPGRFSRQRPALDDAASFRWREQFVRTFLEQDIYRTAKGEELDLVLERRGRRVGVECKASSAPTVGRGFWTARADLGLEETWVVARIPAPFPLGDGAEAVPLEVALARLNTSPRELDPRSVG